MDLQQKKLTHEEWNSLEIPVAAQELGILKMIQKGYDDVLVRDNDTSSLITYIKIDTDLPLYHDYFYEKYFKSVFSSLAKRYNCPNV